MPACAATDDTLNIRLKQLVNKILDDVLAGSGLTYTVNNKLIVIHRTEESGELINTQQQKTVSGKVTDSAGNSFPGVAVVIKGTTNGNITDVNGKYSLSNVPADATLVFTFVGMKTQEAKVGVDNTVNVVLIEENIGLGEVVVIGYGSSKKSDVTGSVSQVKASELSQTPSSSIDNLIKGKSAGLQVLSSSGEPGSGSTIRIRGNNSFNNNNPLYVVDGIPMGDAGNLKQINTNDIETIDVLKDASATAIYGSRGANGVIMVTTKKGKANQDVIEINQQVSVSSLAKPFDLIFDPYQYAELNNEGRVAAGYAPLYVGAEQYGTYYPSLMEIANGTWKSKTFWPDEIYREALTTNTTIAARGGNEKTQYSMSLGYLNQDGMVINNNYKKYTGNLKLDQKIRKNISLGVNMNISMINHKNANAAGSERRSPVFPVYDENGDYFQIGLQDYYNPIAVADNILNGGKDIDLFATGYLNWEVTNDLTFHSNFTTKYGEAISDYYEPSKYGASGYQFHGYGTIGNFQGINNVADNYLTFKKTFADKHRFVVMTGTSFEKYTERTSVLIGKNFVNDFLQNESLGSAQQKDLSNSSYQTSLLSFMGRLNYNYDDKYLLTATMRADGSSKFGSDNKFGYFPSLAAAWNVHNESFFPKNVIVNSLKMRLGFGITGNQAMPPYRTLDRLGNNVYWMDGNWVTGYGPGIQYAADSQSRKFYEGLANSGLKWESTSQGNIGTDIQLLKGRVQITADYYSKKTINLLRLVDVAISSGYHKQWQNDGEVTNKGVEFSVNADLIRKEDLSWNVGFNISHNKNVVVNYDYHSAVLDGVTYIVPSGNNGTEFEYFRGQTNYLTNGQPMNFFFGYKTDWIVQTKAEGLAAGLSGAMSNPGEIKYVDTNKNGQIDAYDRVNLGSPDPKFFFGFNTGIRYKRFDLSGSFTGSYGNKIVNFQKLNQGSSQLQRWSVDNPTNEFPSLNSGRSVMFSDLFIEDGSYLKVQNLALEYTVDVTKVKFIKSLRINLNCENVWTFTKFSGYDPEVGLDGLYGGSGYPRPRTISTGLNVQF